MTTPEIFSHSAHHLRMVMKAAREAGRLQMRHYGRLGRNDIHMKAMNDFVTFVDKQSQDRIVHVLKKAFPSYGFIGEEGLRSTSRERMWIIDPLDGTSNYIHRIPAFCVSIGLMENNEPVLGVVYDPVHDEMFTSSRGHGAFLNNRRIKVSKTKGLDDSFLATGFPFRLKNRFEPYHESFPRLFYLSRGIRRLGSAALDLCYTACGRFDGFWEIGLKIWDTAASIVILEEAGGRVTDLNNSRNFILTGDTAAGNPGVHRDLLRVLRKVPRLSAGVLESLPRSSSVKSKVK